MEKKRFIGKESALPKIRHFCSYQERCHREVRDKLYEYGLDTGTVEELITGLIADGFLNEERFAKQYVGGKFRMKQWGRVKIRYSLKQLGVSEANIRIGLREIAESDYSQVLHQLTHAKWASLSGEKKQWVRAQKAQSFLIQRGFEAELIREALHPYLSTSKPTSHGRRTDHSSGH